MDPSRVPSILIVSLLAFSCQKQASEQNERLAPLLEGMGDHQVPITTRSPEAQRFFDQGLVLSYGFNHGEAARAFREAIRLDPDCAMCHWGLALVLGPNINATMDAADAPEAYAAARSAMQLAQKATEKEQQYIAALTTRYVAEPAETRDSLDLAYADAMRMLARRYPQDDDAATLFAEALMDTTPWDYWTDGAPKPVTEEILSTLESVLKRNPEHPGANHFYIHTVEALRPEMGVDAADRLGRLVPGAGHLVHMPSHIYLRVGRYHDASLANEKAIAADDSYATQCRTQGMYPLAYMPHNHHFLWAAATLEGRSGIAIAAASHMAATANHEKIREAGYGTIQHFWITPLYCWTRFGKWDRILSQPAPPDDLLYPKGVWHYARGIALVRGKQLAEAAEELRRLQAIAETPELKAVTIWDINSTQDLLRIAVEVLAGELEAARGLIPKAVARLRKAVELEDGLNYDEPPPWHQPVRQSLGAILVEAGQPVAAEQVYHEDLERFPENGWSLYGLAQSLRAQEKYQAAKETNQRFQDAWERADVELTSSRF